MFFCSGNKSFRDRNDGSWFIQTFCDNLQKYAEHHDLDHIMRFTANDVVKILNIDENNKVLHQVLDRKYDSGSKVIYLRPQGKQIFS